MSILGSEHLTLSPTETAAPANPTGSITPPEAQQGVSAAITLFGLAALVLIGALILLLKGYGWENLRKERAFDMLILLGTFVLPMLIPFPVKWLEPTLHVTIPTDAASVQLLNTRAVTILSIFVIITYIITIVVGMLWNRDWWKYAALFWGWFTVFYTTVFTNAPGFFTGLLGSLGYWLMQHGVERGSQPEYYYILVQIPMYEFLPALGSLVAIGLGLKKLFGQRTAVPEKEADPRSEDANFVNVFSLLVFWVITSTLAFTIAGERMPWLTYHMAWPMVLLTGWGIGQMIEATIKRLQGSDMPQTMLAISVSVIFALAVFNALRAYYGPTPPFQGTELAQLQATLAFLLPFLAAIASAALLAYLMRDDLASVGVVMLYVFAGIAVASALLNGAMLLKNASNPAYQFAGVQPETLRLGAALLALIGSIVGIRFVANMPRKGAFTHLFALTLIGLLTVQTGRTAFRASYINYDNATEYLVYAHGATGVKDVMKQVEEISKRTTGGLNAVVAYDASSPDTGVSWPFVWYLRDFTALRSFDEPTRSLREAVAVIVDQKNFDKIQGALGDGYYEFDYIRMWWPNQDYFNLDRTRVLNAITDPNIRAGIFDIWFHRDYTRYAQATGNSNMTLVTWQPADLMKLYIRKDVAAQIWNYGVGPSESPLASDPYQAGSVLLAADLILGADRYPPLGLNAPRAIAPGLNDDFYIADSRNHRILHIAADGTLLHAWGTFADVFAGNAPIGTFNEPWGVAVGPDGSVYVSDTWNHRIQKFAPDGSPITMWGQYGQPMPENPESVASFWGPRGIAVDAQGRVLVADTGNKRIVVFDQDGNYISEFGSAGFAPGQFDEPVAIAIAPNGTIYVTDTWNQRVQAFLPSEDGTFYTPLLEWEIHGWFGQSLENKPFIAVNKNGHVFVTDPEGYRVLEFTENGEFVRAWGDYGSGPEEIGLASGIAVDTQGHIWVTDAGNNRILRYTLP
ncbi:MAG TPA: 6-bladed beta-propeller, partial [Anaerolineales bacterium]|nr:6-bladed beta-propeller [Anaerolineales bacterium]